MTGTDNDFGEFGHGTPTFREAGPAADQVAPDPAPAPEQPAPPAPPPAPAQAAPAPARTAPVCEAASTEEVAVSEPESGVPIPEGRHKYPFKDLGVNDSFQVHLREKIDDPEELKRRLKAMRSALSSSATMFGRRNNVTLIVRKVGPRSFRCWRTE